LAWAFFVLAENHYQAGRLLDANASWSQAVRVWRDAVRKHPEDFASCNQLAMVLCYWLDPKLRDPQEAARLARSAVDLAPHLPRSWLVLGAARYRLGEWSAAVEALQIALEKAEARSKLSATDLQADEAQYRDSVRFSQGRVANVLFFLAMAQWRCGQAKDAIENYQRAVRKMESDFMGRDLYDRAIRAEAAALLGVEPAPEKAEQKHGIKSPSPPEGLKQREEKIPPQGKIRLTEALERLVQLYDTWDHKDKADEWRKKLTEVKSAKPAETKKDRSPYRGVENQSRRGR
jgi:tetratricopeptide (TPR) repeat protein